MHQGFAHERDCVRARAESLIRRHGARSVCDYGCGQGGLLRGLEEKHGPALALTGIDYLSRMCAKHRPPATGGIEFIDRGTAAFEELAREPRFDLVVSAWALHHYQYPVKELGLIAGMLKPGGTALFVDWNLAADTAAQAMKNLVSFIDEAYAAFTGSYHRHHYTLAEALDLLGATGLEVVASSEEEFDCTREQRGGDVEHKLEQLRGRVESVGTMDPPPAGKEPLLSLLSLGVELLERHGYEYARFFTVTARRPR